jgi:glycerol-3-phosphate cytidylyltransferase
MNKGVIAGNFDVIHPGYVKTFKECKENCDHFTILLHSDPTIERPEKLKPILSLEERMEVLYSIKYIDEIQVYTYEKELIEILKNGDFTIRFLGDDYIDRDFTGSHFNIPIHYISRDHGWSTTKFKNLLVKSLKSKED